jgi:hypothetical protein
MASSLYFSTPGNTWNDLFNNLAAQGKAFNGPLSPSNWYYAYLATAEQDWQTHNYVVVFEVIPAEWVNNTIMAGDATIQTLAPISPVSLYFLNQVDETTLLNALGLKSEDQLAEGSWYLLQLIKDDKGQLVGDLCDPDADLDLGL